MLNRSKVVLCPEALYVDHSMSKCFCVQVFVNRAASNQNFFESYSHVLQDLVEKTEVELEDEKENSDASLKSKVEKTSYNESC